MKVFLTGATGFIGTYVLRQLLESGHETKCLVRSGSESQLEEFGERIHIVNGDITDAASLGDGMAGCDAVVHLVGIIEENPSKGITFERIHFEGARNVADTAIRLGIPRFIHMSSNGARENGVSRYQTSKWQAEQYIRNAGFDHWTIFRPTIVFGKPGAGQPEFATRLVQQLIRPFPVLPVFGDGLYRLQLVSVEEVAEVFVQSLTNPAAKGKRYCVSGKNSYTFLDILDIITRATGRKPKPKIKQPVWLARPLVNSAGRVGLIPIKPDQFEMLIEGNTCDSSALYADFAIDYKPFAPENLQYIRE